MQHRGKVSTINQFRKSYRSAFMKNESDMIINYLLKERRTDFTGYCQLIFERQLNQRIGKTGTGTIPGYYAYLQSHSEEIDNLIDTLIVNVSGFFRNPLVFNYLSSEILPLLISRNSTSGSPLRIWSAGCAAGEEPHSIAIEINKLQKNMATDLAINIFATDIDSEAIEKARTSVYKPESLNNVQFKDLRHFTKHEDSFSLNQDIKQLVNFSKYDLLDKKSYCPPESVYGNFDLILCRNVLIYYNARHQNKIFTKLYRSLKENGYLVLGETETPTNRFRDYFRKVNNCCHIFKKIP